MEEKDSLQKQLIDKQANFASCNNQRLLLEEHVKILKEKIDKGSSIDNSFSLASELGNLSVKDVELKKAQYELHSVKKQVQENEALLKDAIVEKTRLQDIISSFRQALIKLKTTLWDNINREIKKVKEYLILLDEEKKLANLSLTNAKTMLESLGGKLTIVEAVINLLISQTNAQLQFARVENRSDLLFNANKYIIKRETIKEVIEKTNFLFLRSKDFKDLFKDLFELELPFFYNEEGDVLSDVAYLTKLQERAKDTSDIDQLSSIIRGKYLQEVLSKDFTILHQLRHLNKGFPPLSYNLYVELDTLYRSMLVSDFPASLIWKQIEAIANKTTQER